MDGTVKLPVFGVVKKKTAAVVGGVSFAGILLIWYVRQRKAAQAASAAASSPSSAAATVTDSAGNVCAALNPATGFCPGSAQDQEALSGSLSTDAAYDTSDLGDGLSGYYYGSGAATQSSAPGPGNFSDNAEWAQYVEAYLTGTLGGDASTVGNAIGKYLTGQPVTSDQVTIINEAIAYGGQPPQSGTSGDPPGINTTAGTTGTASGSAAGTSSTASSSAPAATSSTASSTAAKGGPITAIPVGLHTTQVSATSVGVAWTAPTIPSGQGPLTGYTAQVFNANGTAEGSPWTVGPGQLYANAGGLKSKTAYHLNVWCNPAKSGGPHASVSFTTT